MTHAEPNHQWQVAEYEALKAEQRALIRHRDSLITFMLVATGAVLGIGAGGSPSGDFSVVLPVVALIVCATYVVQDIKVSRIGEYLVVIGADGSGDDNTGSRWSWEHWHGAHRSYVFVKVLEVLFEVALFVVIPLVVSLTFRPSSSADRSTGGLVAACACAGLALTVLVFARALVQRGRA